MPMSLDELILLLLVRITCLTVIWEVGCWFFPLMIFEAAEFSADADRCLPAEPKFLSLMPKLLFEAMRVTAECFLCLLETSIKKLRQYSMLRSSPDSSVIIPVFCNMRCRALAFFKRWVSSSSRWWAARNLVCSLCIRSFSGVVRLIF